MKFKFYFVYFIVWLFFFPAINYKLFLPEKVEGTESDSVTTYVVKKWYIKNSVDVVWETSLVDEQSLQFNKVWTITKVNFRAWDKIKKWDVIAEIDNSEAYVSIEENRLSLDNAKINLKQLYEWPDESNVLQSKNSIINAENSIKLTEKELENIKITQENSLNKLKENIATSNKELESSKSSLELSRKELETFKKQIDDSLESTETSKSSTVTDIENNFQSYLLDIGKTIEESDYIMWVTNENKDRNDKFYDFLWARNRTIKNDARASLVESINLYSELKQDLDEYDYSWNKEDVESLLNSYSEIFYKLYETTDLIYKTVENSIESVWSLTSSDINSMKSTMNSYRGSSLSKVSSIKSSLEKLKTLTNTDLISEWNSNSIASKQESIKWQELSIEKKELDIKNAIKSYNETVESYKVTLESKENDLKSKRLSLEISKMNLEELQQWPTAENIRKAENSVKQAEIRLESAYKNLDDYKLISPFDWVVRKIDYMVWDNLTNDTDKFVFIENPDLVEITVMLDQISIVDTKIWDKAIINFDAYKNLLVDWKISLIDTTPKKVSWVVYYEVKVILDDLDFDKKILSWMTANIEIITESKEDVLLVKTSAIQSKNWKKVVIIDDKWKQKIVEIKTWISSEWNTEVISWLSEWDIIYEKEFKIEATEEQNWWLFNIPKWWGGARWWWGGMR